MEEKPIYNTWIRKSKIVLFYSIAGVILAISVLGFTNANYFFIALLSLPFLYIAIIINITAYRFSPRGGDIQNKIHELIIEKSNLRGRIIDIGCGSGNLIIKMAKWGGDSQYFGIDYWGSNWEYSKGQCERNAELEKVPGISFIKSSASKLPFENESFDHAVSCLTFHEVQDVENKTDSLKEALRILKKGGGFVFFDLFGDRKFYPSLDKVRAVLESSGARGISIEPLSRYMDLAFPINTGKVLKHAFLITGEKDFT